MVSTSAFLTSLVTSFIVFVILVFVYTWLSRKPGNFVVYYPSRIFKGLGPPDHASRRGPLDWIRQAYRATEDEIVALAGLDAAVYIHFFTAVLEILVYSAIFCVPVLIPIAATSHYNAQLYASNKNNTYSTIDNLSMGNVEQKSSKLWAFLLATYWVSLVTYFVLFKSYKHVMNLRAREQLSARARPEQVTVLVRDIPKPDTHETRTEQVDSFFKKLHPDSYEKCTVVTKVNKGFKILKELETAKKKLEHAEAVYNLSKTKKNSDGVRPMHKTGTLGLVGPKVDSLDCHRENVKGLTLKLEEEQKRTRAEDQQAAAFVFFNNRRSAAEASQVVHAPDALQWQVYQAPQPCEVIWENLPIPVYERAVREFMVHALVFFIIVFYMIPIAAISALTTLNNLEKIVPFIKSIVKIGPLNTILQAYLPQVALIVFLALLPKLLMALTKAEGIPSKSHLVRATSGKYFYFIIFNVFLGFTLFGTVFASLSGFKTLLNSGNLTVSYVVQLFGSKLPANADYFITFVALKFFIGYGLDLSRVVPLIIYHLKRKYLCKTEKELQEAWAPGSFSYHTAVPNDLLIVTIALCYSVIAPLIFVFAILYFAIGWLVNRNQALNVYIPEYESNGRMWPHIHSRILAALFVAQITMLGYFGVKQSVYAVLLVFLPIMTVAFAMTCKKKYYPSFKVTPLAVASQEVKELPSLPAVVEAYTPPCLLEADRFEDVEKFEDARSSATSMTSPGITSPA